MRQAEGRLVQPACAPGTERPRYNNFSALLIVALVFLPLSTPGNLIRLAVAVALFASSVIGGRTVYEFRTLFMLDLMLLSSVVPLIAVLIMEGNADYDSYIHEFQRVCFNSLLILTAINCRISFKTI
jgi:hypothetical protein